MLNLNQYKLRCRIIIAKTFIALRVHSIIEWTFTRGKLRALNCLLQSRRRCGYSVDDHPPRHPPRHRQCRWPQRRLLVQAVSCGYIVQYSSSDYDNNTAFGGNIIQPPDLWIQRNLLFHIPKHRSAQLWRVFCNGHCRYNVGSFAAAGAWRD